MALNIARNILQQVGLMKQNSNPSYKVIIVGQSGVGKTTLMLSYIQELAVQDVKPTVGIQFGSKNINLPGGKQITLHLWDTAGAQKYRSVVKNFYRGSSAVFILYSITSLASFKKLDYWLKESKQNSNKNTIIFAIGTHKDMQNSRQVSEQQLRDWATRNGVDGAEQCSARDVGAITNLFSTLAQKIYFDKLLRKSCLDKSYRMHAFDSVQLGSSAVQVPSSKRWKKCCNI